MNKINKDQILYGIIIVLSLIMIFLHFYRREQFSVGAPLLSDAWDMMPDLSSLWTSTVGVAQDAAAEANAALVAIERARLAAAEVAKDAADELERVKQAYEESSNMPWEESMG